MKNQNIQINYWPLLRAMGIRYGKEVTLTDEGNVIVRRLEYKGRKFQTAKEIYESATAN